MPFSTERAIDAAIAADEAGFPELLADFAHEYGARARTDHQIFVDLFRNGRIPACGPPSRKGAQRSRNTWPPLRPLRERMRHSHRYGHIRDPAQSRARGAVHGRGRDAQHRVARAAVRGPAADGTVAAIAGAVFVVAYALAGRERGFGKIAALLVPLELTADTVFTAGQHACYGRAGGPVTGPLRSVGLDVLCSGGTVGTPLTRVTGTGTDRVAALLAHADPATAWLLLAAHVGVGLLAAAWLRRGERALADLLRAAAATTFRPLLVAVAAVSVRPPPHAGPRARPAPSPRVPACSCTPWDGGVPRARSPSPEPPEHRKTPT